MMGPAAARFPSVRAPLFTVASRRWARRGPGNREFHLRCDVSQFAQVIAVQRNPVAAPAVGPIPLERTGQRDSVTTRLCRQRADLGDCVPDFTIVTFEIAKLADTDDVEKVL